MLSPGRMDCCCCCCCCWWLKELGSHTPEVGVPVRPELQVPAKLHVELLGVALLLHNLRKHLEALLNYELLYLPEHIAPLQFILREGQLSLLGLHHACDQVEPLRYERIAVDQGEGSAQEEAEVVAHHLWLKEVAGLAAGHKEQRVEAHGPVPFEVLHRQVVLPVGVDVLPQHFREGPVEGLEVGVGLLPLLLRLLRGELVVLHVAEGDASAGPHLDRGVAGDLLLLGQALPAGTIPQAAQCLGSPQSPPF
mmetsp:Transcript_20523/g.64138  ORF Transcript_20523/g.64138 Transcript_20523/m.64138 type:complete len:251 (+) Transcript_20523:209-961(+)